MYHRICEGVRVRVLIPLGISSRRVTVTALRKSAAVMATLKKEWSFMIEVKKYHCD